MRWTLGAALPALLAGAAAMAEPIMLDVQANHPNGSVMIVRSIEPGPDSTKVEIVVTTAGKEVQLNRNNSMILVGNTGARHLLIPPADNDVLEVPPNSRLSGEMVFSGRLDPAAERVLLTTNDGVGGSSDNQYTSMPVFRLDLPLREGGAATAGDGAGAPAGALAAAPAAAAASRVIALDEQVNHPNGTVLIVRSLETTPDGMVVDLKVTSGDREIELNRAGAMHLIDERGARYQVVAPPDNPNIAIPSATSIEGKVFFAGRLQPGVGRVTLLINEGPGGSASNRRTNSPEFRVEIPLGG